MQLVIFCICSLCSPRVTPSYLFSHMDRQSFLAHDGIQTLDMLSLGFGTTKIASAPEGPSATRVPVPTKVAGHWWFNGRILACHVGEPGPIPGQCKDSLLLSKMGACTISKMLKLQELKRSLFGPEGSQMLFYVWFEFTSWLRGVGQGKGVWDRFLTIWARQLCLCLYYNGKINDYWEIEPLICKWLCPGQMWIR